MTNRVYHDDNDDNDDITILRLDVEQKAGQHVEALTVGKEKMKAEL